jgi:thiamine transport system substrate-binding protein
VYWLLLFLWASSVSASPSELTVYTYDSFTGAGSLGESLSSLSKKKTGCTTKFVPFSTVGEAISQVALEGPKTQADILVGVDQSLRARADELAIEELPSALFSELQPDLLQKASYRWLPFDYGFLSIVYDDRRKNVPPPRMGLMEFATHAAYKKRLVLEDARTSSLGRSLLTWTKAVFPGGEYARFWKGLFQQVLTVSPGWSAAYGLFLSQEADFVFSYTTSPAYHIEKEMNSHIKAMIFPEGNFRQVEMAGILKSSKQKKCAVKWLELLSSSKVQKEIPRRQWMYPARKGVKLPASFASLPLPSKVIDAPERAANSDAEVLRQWTQFAAGFK